MCVAVCASVRLSVPSVSRCLKFKGFKWGWAGVVREGLLLLMGWGWAAGEEEEASEVVIRVRKHIYIQQLRLRSVS